MEGFISYGSKQFETNSRVNRYLVQLPQNRLRVG